MAKRDIDFLFELGSLRNVPRAWQQILTGRVQNISEHIFRVTFIAWTIAIAEKADVNKVIRMALIHDIAESRAGDIAFMHRQYVTRHEDLAIEHIFKDTEFEKDVQILIAEYEDRKSLEAKIIKDADNLDVDIELKELAKISDSSAIAMQKDRLHTIKSKKLYTKTAKKMWDKIQKTDPNAWNTVLNYKHITNEKGAK